MIIRLDIVSTHPDERHRVTFQGTTLVDSTRQPLLDGARALLAMGGHDPRDMVEVWRPGAAAWSLRGRLGHCAGLTVEEGNNPPRFRKWQPYPHAKMPN